MTAVRCAYWQIWACISYQYLIPMVHNGRASDFDANESHEKLSSKEKKNAKVRQRKRRLKKGTSRMI